MMEINKRLYMDVHVIQSMPPSCINRDDTGSPKTAQYGGVRRARVSSQAWKRAIRKYFTEHYPDVTQGARTKNVVAYVAKKIVQQAPEVDEKTAFNKAKAVLEIAGVKTDKEGKTDALFFMGDHQAKMLAKAVVDGKDTKENEEYLKRIINECPEIDIALFGRMLAGEKRLNTDACCQVAHALSTHAAQTEYDFYSAIDDFSAEDQSGASMLDNAEFNSPTIYRYANVSIHELLHLLGDEVSALNACKLFIEAFSNSMPTGKSNSYANQTIPAFIMITLREDRSVNLVSAFEKPVIANSKGGYVDKSVEKLTAELGKAGKFVNPPVANFYLNVADQEAGDIGNSCDSLKDLWQKVGEEIEKYLSKAGE